MPWSFVAAQCFIQRRLGAFPKDRKTSKNGSLYLKLMTWNLWLKLMTWYCTYRLKRYRPQDHYRALTYCTKGTVILFCGLSSQLTGDLRGRFRRRGIKEAWCFASYVRRKSREISIARNIRKCATSIIYVNTIWVCYMYTVYLFDCY